MNRIPRVVLALLVVALASSSPAQNTQVSPISLTPSLGGASGASVLAPGGLGSAPSALSLTPMLSLTPTLSVISAPSLAEPASFAPAKISGAAGTPVALTPVFKAPATPGLPVAKTVDGALTPAAKVAPALEALDLSAESRHGKDRGNRRDGGSMFDGSRQRAQQPVAQGQNGRKGENGSGFIKNADGVWVGGRVAEQALWINGMHAELSAQGIDLSDVMDVMDDAYDEARVKLGSAEKAAQTRNLEASSVHLEGTRNWVDAVLQDTDGRYIAVHTHRVYFHPAHGNPASEIAEGIRRASKYLDKVKEDFAPGGLAEHELDTEFKQVELSFDTRGYKEIETALRAKEKEFHELFPGRFHFRYITEPKMESKALRAEYNRLVEQFMDQKDGLMNIIDGVTYSREVGVGHELNSHKKRLAMGLKITQAGRDFFGKKVLPDGRIVEEYKTEFDAVTEKAGADGKKDVTLWEDKSARVWMPIDKMMEDTFLYKLRIYRENRALIEESLGAPLKVAFSVDVGGSMRRAAKQGVLVWQDPRSMDLMEHLKSVQDKLSKEYGFPVSFIFVNSHPGESPDLFYQQPVDLAVWQAQQQGGGGKGKGGGRKNGRR